MTNKEALRAVSLGQAMQIVASFCDGARSLDGAGFSSMDAFTGHRLAATPESAWNESDREKAKRLAVKYRGQLERAGVQVNTDALKPSPKAAKASYDRPPERAFEIKEFENSLVVSFPYRAELVAGIKRVPRQFRDFSNENKTWTIKKSVQAREAIASFFSEFGGFFDYDYTALLEALDEEDEALKEKEQEIYEASVLHDAEIEVPNLGDGCSLFGFQRAGVSFVSSVKRVLVGDEMGTGKTVTALASAEYNDAFPLTVVCPASVRLNWCREALKWLPQRSVCVLMGNEKFSAYLDSRAQLQLEPVPVDMAFDITVLNFEILDRWVQRLIEVGPKMVVVDESHYVKNPKAKRTKATKRLARQADFRLCMSGTPLLNKPKELISQLDVLGRLDEFGGFWGFAKRYCGAHRDRFGLNIDGASNLGELNERLRKTCFIRRSKADVMKDLPPKQRTSVPLQIDNWNEYAKAEENLIHWMKEQSIRDEDFLKSIAGLSPEDQRAAKSRRAKEQEQKVRNAQQLVRLNELRKIVGRGKLKGVKDWIDTFLEGSDEKLVVFAYHEHIQKHLLEAYPESAHLLGEDNSVVRDQNIHRFQNDPDCRLIVCSLNAAGIGVTLTAASNVAFTELGWTPGIMDQAEDRCHRQGQKDSVNCWYLLASGTIEVEIAELIDQKRRVVQEATDGLTNDEAQNGIASELIGRLMEKDAVK